MASASGNLSADWHTDDSMDDMDIDPPSRKVTQEVRKQDSPTSLIMLTTSQEFDTSLQTGKCNCKGGCKIARCKCFSLRGGCKENCSCANSTESTPCREFQNSLFGQDNKTRLNPCFLDVIQKKPKSTEPAKFEETMEYYRVLLMGHEKGQVDTDEPEGEVFHEESYDDHLFEWTRK